MRFCDRNACLVWKNQNVRGMPAWDRKSSSVLRLWRVLIGSLEKISLPSVASSFHAVILRLTRDRHDCSCGGRAHDDTTVESDMFTIMRPI